MRRDIVLNVINNCNGAICDDCAQQAAEQNHRQDVYQDCELLDGQGLIKRGKGLCSICKKEKKVSSSKNNEKAILELWNK